MRINSKFKVAGITILATAAAGALAALIVRDQISRYRRNLFSPHALQRLAALGHISRETPSVDNIRLLRDFIAWEPRRLLRERAAAIVRRMEIEAAQAVLPPGPGVA